MKKIYKTPEIEVTNITVAEDILLASGDFSSGDSNGDGWSDMWA